MAVPKHNISAVQLQPPIKPCHWLADLAQVKSRHLCVIYPYSLFVVCVRIHMFMQIHHAMRMYGGQGLAQGVFLHFSVSAGSPSEPRICWLDWTSSSTGPGNPASASPALELQGAWLNLTLEN